MAVLSSCAWPNEQILADLHQLRHQGPLTHCVTNIVAAGFTANVLLAAGASPAMVENTEEAGEFAVQADGLLINLGTLSPSWAQAMRLAAAAASNGNTPWVLDPVAVGISRYRTEFARELLDLSPSVVRGNASEIMTLAGVKGTSKGVDSQADSGDAIEAARTVAGTYSTVVALSGVTDYITNGETVFAVPGGNSLMTRVTGMGCALGALIAAFLGAGAAVMDAAIGASAVLAEAGQRAATNSNGPGSFAMGLLDELYRLDVSAGQSR